MTDITNSNGSGRPTSLEEMSAVMSRTFSEEGWKHGLSFQPQSTDVIVSPYSKCGTTWLQQIVHGLRTGGDMEFDDISRVVPWLERAHDQGLDLQASQRAWPRAYKSHLSWHDIPKGGRYIVSLRDPKDALVSRFRFLEGWWFEAGSISVSTFAREHCMANRDSGYWNHLASWWEQRHNENVLLLVFENMKQDLPQTVRRIAQFIGCALDEDLLEIVVRQASLEFMLAHKNKFDDLLMREQGEKIGGLPAGGDSAKVKDVRVEDKLPEEILAEMDAIWREEIDAKFGLASYQALREALALEANGYSDN